jgi:hypothetical protein
MVLVVGGRDIRDVIPIAHYSLRRNLWVEGKFGSGVWTRTKDLGIMSPRPNALPGELLPVMVRTQL